MSSDDLREMAPIPDSEMCALRRDLMYAAAEIVDAIDRLAEATRGRVILELVDDDCDRDPLTEAPKP